MIPVAIHELDPSGARTAARTDRYTNRLDPENNRAYRGVRNVLLPTVGDRRITSRDKARDRASVTNYRHTACVVACRSVRGRSVGRLFTIQPNLTVLDPTQPKPTHGYCRLTQPTHHRYSTIKSYLANSNG